MNIDALKAAAEVLAAALDGCLATQCYDTKEYANGVARAMTIVTGKAYGVMKVTLGYMVMEMHNGRH